MERKEITRRPNKLWKKLLAITLQHNLLFGSHQKYYFDCNINNVCTVELKGVNKIDDSLKPVEILLKYFCHTIEDAKKLRRKPSQVRKMIGWKVEDGNVDELLQDVIYTMQKDKSLFEAEMKKYYYANKHSRAMLSTRL
ncbi:unnamed protein product [Bursaphelenchus okinawaensis]|uniref:Uncharacterized protein n=1 Tax=Bursaphelenchus okinawaensis TaxID=465554 RepID=A0A811KQC2_9BILA|nr:unnamed protein product [Bursaphelenchus okinawaensis]CAG9111295.1 unnamed protein product [Bursaphelenchus okinawaensis]